MTPSRPAAAPAEYYIFHHGGASRPNSQLLFDKAPALLGLNSVATLVSRQKELC